MYILERYSYRLVGGMLRFTGIFYCDLIFVTNELSVHISGSMTNGKVIEIKNILKMKKNK